MTLASFAIGFFVAAALDWWLRDRALSNVAPRCMCGRNTDHIVFVVEAHGIKKVDRAWGLCSWCASCCDVTVRQEILDRVTLS